MLQQFFYQEKGLFLQSLHSAASLVYIMVLFILPVTRRNSPSLIVIYLPAQDLGEPFL